MCDKFAVMIHVSGRLVSSVELDLFSLFGSIFFFSSVLRSFVLFCFIWFVLLVVAPCVQLVNWCRVFSLFSWVYCLVQFVVR